MSSEVLAVVEATPARRALGAGMLAVLGGLLLYTALNAQPGLLASLFLLSVGCGAIWLAVRLWQAASGRVELTEEELRSSTGEVLARIEDIESVDRGFFAFKPSNGFVVTLKQRAPRAWHPGLWWRMGRRVGVGGVTPAVQGKGMADMLSGLIAMRVSGIGGR